MAIGFLFVPDARDHLAPYLALFLAAAATSLLAAGILSASRPRFLLLCGAVLRATLLARAPDLSDDAWRYLWDGRVAAQGISPYALAPDDPALSGLDPELGRRVAHRDLRTVYPPAAQAAFRAFGSRGLIAWKAFAAAADLSVVALLANSGAGYAAALYAFHPLPVTETAGEGHVDSLGVALLLACLAHMARRRRVTAGVAFAMSALTKYVCLAAAIPLLRKGRYKFIAAAALTAGALWLAATRPGASPSGGLADYAARWDFNSPAYGAAARLMDLTDLPGRAKGLLLRLKERWHDPEWTAAVFPCFYSGFFARALLGLLLAAVLVGISRRLQAAEDAVFASLAALMLLSPTLQPWYLLWVLPFAAKSREPSFLYLSFAAPLSYALLFPLPGVSPGLVQAAEFVPFYALLFWTVWRQGSRGAEVPR